MRKVLIGLVVVLALAQLYRPALNDGPAAPGPNDIFVRFPAPEALQAAVREGCYDCHSNRTRYPWYAHVQPVAAWTAHHVDEGKHELNFSEFGSYSAKKAAHKLNEAIEMVDEGEMPLASYTWMHADARWSPEQKKAFADWARALSLSLVPASP